MREICCVRSCFPEKVSKSCAPVKNGRSITVDTRTSGGSVLISTVLAGSSFVISTLSSQVQCAHYHFSNRPTMINHEQRHQLTFVKSG